MQIKYKLGRGEAAYRMPLVKALLDHVVQIVVIPHQDGGQSIKAHSGDAMQLKVEMVRRNGSVSHVTADSKTNYFSASPGLEAVGPAGRVWSQGLTTM